MIIINTLLEELNNAKVELISVTKTRSEEQILNLYAKGLRKFGENRVKELVTKYNSMPKDIEWHMIGHLQTKKVKHIVPFVKLIHSLDRNSLWNELNKQAKRQNIKIRCLLEIKIASESSKAGYNFEELTNYLSKGFHEELSNVEICGVMGMATFTDDREKVLNEFKHLKSHFDFLQKQYFKENHFQWISMGMSGDYKLAIEAGTNMVRIGSLLFK